MKICLLLFYARYIRKAARVLAKVQHKLIIAKDQ